MVDMSLKRKQLERCPFKGQQTSTGALFAICEENFVSQTEVMPIFNGNCCTAKEKFTQLIESGLVTRVEVFIVEFMVI